MHFRNRFCLSDQMTMVQVQEVPVLSAVRRFIIFQSVQCRFAKCWGVYKACMCVAPLRGSRIFCVSDEFVWILPLYAFLLAKSILRSSLWFLEYEGSCFFQFAEPSWNISPGKPASCSSLARLLAVAMFCVSYMFSHVWPSLRSWSAAGAVVASRVQLHWFHSPPGVVCEAWVWEVHPPRPLRRTTPTCSRCPLMSWSWSTTWHCLATVCWTTCNVCLRCCWDVDCVWRRYFGSRVFHVSWMFVRPPDIVTRDTLLYFQTVIHSLSWLAVLFVDHFFF